MPTSKGNKKTGDKNVKETKMMKNEKALVGVNELPKVMYHEMKKGIEVYIIRYGTEVVTEFYIRMKEPVKNEAIWDSDDGNIHLQLTTDTGRIFTDHLIFHFNNPDDIITVSGTHETSHTVYETSVTRESLENEELFTGIPVWKNKEQLHGTESYIVTINLSEYMEVEK